MKSWKMMMGLLALFSASAFADVIDTNWQFAKNERGVEVHTGEVAGSKFLAFQATTFIAAPLMDVLQVITDHDSYIHWYDNCEGAELLEQITPQEALVRVVIDTPFPLATRDAVNKVVVTSSSTQADLLITSAADHYPEQKRMVRMRDSLGGWRLKAVEGGTEVQHFYHTDPLANVPAWMVNRFVVQGPINTLSALRERVLR